MRFSIFFSNFNQMFSHPIEGSTTCRILFVHLDPILQEIMREQSTSGRLNHDPQMGSCGSIHQF